jgi:membrane protein YdbS with pleckstrin-like domain
MLVAASAPPAFLCSFLLRAGSVAWFASIGIWALLFLFLYLFYLPARWRGISLCVREDYVCMRRGVFYQTGSTMPISAIRFTRVLQKPAGRLFGICALHIAAAGGSVFMPGLSRQEARSLAAALRRDEEDAS